MIPELMLQTKESAGILRRVFLLLIAGLLLCCLAGPLSATRSTGAAFLKFGAGSRGLALGGACTALTDDVDALYWNPAGLAMVEGAQLSLNHSEYYQSIRHDFLGFCVPLLGGVAGLSGTYLWVEGIEGRTSLTSPVRSVPVWDAAAALSYGFCFSERIAAGVTVKGFQQTLDDLNATGYAGDAGVQWQISDRYRIGAVLQNAGVESAFVSESSQLPATAKIGFARYWPSERLMTDLDLGYSINDQVWNGALGAEWHALQQLDLRLGYRYNSSMTALDPLSSGSIGFGILLDDFSFDYAFVPFGDLGYTHHASFRVHFGQKTLASTGR